MKTHENEVLLVWRTQSGKILPTSEYRKAKLWLDVGEALHEDMSKHREALQEQVLRQVAGL